MESMGALNLDAPPSSQGVKCSGGRTHHIRGRAHSSTDVFCFCARKLTPHRLAVELLLRFRQGQLGRKRSTANFFTKTAAGRSTRYVYAAGAHSAQRGTMEPAAGGVALGAPRRVSGAPEPSFSSQSLAHSSTACWRPHVA